MHPNADDTTVIPEVRADVPRLDPAVAVDAAAPLGLAELDARKDARAIIDEKRRGRVMGKAIKQFYKQRGH